jgi:hypothetical protein
VRAAATLAVLAGLAMAAVAPAVAATDWPVFNANAARSGTAAAGPTLSAVRALHRRQVDVGGTVDSAAVFVSGVQTGGGTHDLFVMTTTYGKTVAVDASTGAVRWTYVPPGIAGWQGTYRITNAAPAVDKAAGVVYSASPDGKVHRLTLATGAEQRTGAWPVTATRDPTHEKLTSSFNLWGPYLIVTTGGYIGDAPPYQGHVLTIFRRSGRVAHVWNSLCANRHELLTPSSCPSSDSAIWGRSGAVVDPSNGHLFVATGNAPWNGRTDWGDSVLELSANASRLLQTYTPVNQAEMNSGDVDLGSSSPVFVPADPARHTPALVVEAGKDGQLRLLDRRRLNGRDGRIGRLGGELARVATPGQAGLFSAPAVYRQRGRTWLFVGTGGGTGAYTIVPGRRPGLRQVWASGSQGTSPIVVGGLMYVFDPGGTLNVYRPTSPHPVARLSAGSGHWQSPVIGDGHILLGQGNANDHVTTGSVNLYR